MLKFSRHTTNYPNDCLNVVTKLTLDDHFLEPTLHNATDLRKTQKKEKQVDNKNLLNFSK